MNSERDHVHLLVNYPPNVSVSKLVNSLMGVSSRMLSACKDFNAELVEMNSERDHVHLLVNYPPNVSVSKLVNSLMGVSSRMLRKQSQTRFERCFGSCLWSPSYFAASCGGAPLSIIKTYIENQETPN